MTITEYANDLERDLLKAHALLKGGLSHALERLHQSAKSNSACWQSKQKANLKVAEGYCQDSIDAVEKQLGILNYLEAEQEIDSLEDFDRLTNPLSEALRLAQKQMTGALLSGEALFGKHGKQLDAAWHDLRLHLEMVRLQLALDARESAESLDDIRSELGAAFRAAARKAVDDQSQSKGIMRDAFAEFGGFVKKVGHNLQVLFDGTSDQAEVPKATNIQD